MTDETRAPAPGEWEADLRDRMEEFWARVAKEMLGMWDRLRAQRPGFLFGVLAGILEGSLRSLRHYIEDPEATEVSWENPWTELHFSVSWDFAAEEGPILHRPGEIPEGILADLRRGGDPFSRPLMDPVTLEVFGIVAAALAQSAPHLLLLTLTHHMAVRVKGGEEDGFWSFVPGEWEALEALPEEERAARWEELRQPFSIGGMEVEDENGDPLILTPLDHPEAAWPSGPGTSPEWVVAVEERRKDLPELHFTGEANGVPFQGSVVMMVHPLVVDEDKREAYFPIVTGLVLSPAAAIPEGKEDETLAALNPDSWSLEERAALWELLLEEIPRKLEEEERRLEDEAKERETAPVPPPIPEGVAAVAEAGSVAVEDAVSAPPESVGVEAAGVQAVAEAGEVAVAVAPPATVALVPTGAPAPGRRVSSEMGTYPVPRTLAKNAHSLALLRGLGRMFKSSARIPDLDRLGEIAVHAAEELFWTHLEDYLNEALPKRTPPRSWKREALPDGTDSIVLPGLQAGEAREIWTAAVRSMTAGEKGPGLEVEDPEIRKENFFDHRTREVVIRSRIVLWPEAHLVTPEGDRLPPVRFRRDSSPGYLDLLARNGPRPFFADGWLWLPRRRVREGFRIASLPRLLFPEGRKALERMALRDKEETAEKLNRLLHNPTLFQDEDARMVRDLRAAIARAEKRVEKLSVYDTRDLVLCIFEAWYRQRDAWFREAVTLEDGREISTRPHRIIRLDPEDLRVRLDPKATSGENWRGRLFEKLEALTTFERQTRDEKGRKVDVGDRLVERVIDGLTGVDEERTPDYDPGLGLTRLLKKEGGIPSRSFFAVVSVDFMERLVTWAVDEDGAVRWGLEAAKAAERKALVAETPKVARAAAAEKKEAVRRKPFYDQSARLMSLYNLEEWPTGVKDLAIVLLEEVTRRKGKVRRGGETFIACRGSHGKGYKVQTWVKKWGDHLLRTGPKGGVRAFTDFLKALRFLSSHDTLNVQVELRPPRDQKTTAAGEVKWNADALAALEIYSENPPPVYGFKLVPYIPENLESRIRARLWENGIDARDEGEPSVLTPASPGGLSPVDIRGARKRAGWSQSELAAKVGVSQVALSRWENAKTPIPRDRETRLREILGPHLEAGK